MRTQNEAERPRSYLSENRTEWARFRTPALPLILLVLATLAAYANAWPDNLTFDDKAFAASERFSGLSLSDVSRFFTEDLWAASGSATGLYRPLLLVTIAMDAYLYGDWAAGYHLTNILLHLLVTMLVYGFIRHLLLIRGGQFPLSDYIALLAAVVFAVHPVHAEVVNSIFNRSGLLVSVGVIGGLWWFLQTWQSQPFKAWKGLALIYLFVLLCKESGVILPGLAVALLWLVTPGNWRDRLRQGIPALWLLIPLGVYLALRTHALDVPGLPNAAPAPDIKQISSVVDSSLPIDWTRLLGATRVWFEALKMMIWPHPLQLYHNGFSTDAWLGLMLQIMLISGAIVGFRQKRYGLMIGLAFFYIAMLPASRIIGVTEVAPHFAERYVYLPSAGLAIALAFGLNSLAKRFDFRVAMAPVMIALLMLTPITWARNAQWANDVLLYESDYHSGRQWGPILRLVVGAHLQEGNYGRAVEICDSHAKKLKKLGEFSNRCGSAYGQVGRYDDAERAFLLAMNNRKVVAMAHANLAGMYLHLGRKNDAKKHFELATLTEQQPALREFHKGHMLIELYPSDRARLLEAKTHLERALQLQPQLVPARQSLEQLNQVLGSG